MAKLGPGDKAGVPCHPGRSRLDVATHEKTSRADQRCPLSSSRLARLRDADRRRAPRAVARQTSQLVRARPWPSLSPVAWTWFDGLNGSYPFPLVFRDRDWLDARLSCHQDVVKAVCRGLNDTVVDLLRERAALAGGAPDLTHLVTAPSRVPTSSPHSGGSASSRSTDTCKDNSRPSSEHESASTLLPLRSQ